MTHIPPMYTECDYLQAQGDRAVIDTGVPGDNDTLKFAFKFNVDRFIAYRGFFTNYASETANCWRFSEYTGSGVLFNVNNKTGSGTVFDFGSFLNRDTEVILDKSSLVVNANGITYTRVPSNITAGTANNTTIYINSSRRFARTNDDVIKWYYFKIYDNNKLIRDYRPCIRNSDNKAGFYDMVNHTFNPSIGTADFIAGND